jgi:predicted transcriptional regulator
MNGVFKIYKRLEDYIKLKEMIENTFTVQLISERLECCNIEDNFQTVKDRMMANNFDCIGVKNNEEVIGYTEKKSENNFNGMEYKRFTKDDLVSSNTSIMKAIRLFSTKPFVFVLDGTSVNQIITKADCFKDAVRIYIYNLTSNFELLLSIILEYRYSDKNWQENISIERLKSVRDVYTDRIKDNSELALFDCLMLEDKITLVLKDNELASLFQMPKTQLKKYFKKLKLIRNSVSHIGRKPIVTNPNTIIEVISLTSIFSSILEAQIQELIPSNNLMV